MKFDSVRTLDSSLRYAPFGMTCAVAHVALGPPLLLPDLSTNYLTFTIPAKAGIQGAEQADGALQCGRSPSCSFITIQRPSAEVVFAKPDHAVSWAAESFKDFAATPNDGKSGGVLSACILCRRSVWRFRINSVCAVGRIGYNGDDSVRQAGPSSRGRGRRAGAQGGVA